MEWRRNFRATKLPEFHDLRRVQYRNDAGHKRHANTKFAGNKIAKFKIVGVVEKQLREDEIRAGVRFFLQMPPIGVFAVLARYVAFGKAGDADGKIARLADEPDELRGEFEAAGRRLKFAAVRRISAQRENIFTTQRTNFSQKLAHLPASVIDAREMRQCRETVLPLDAIHNHQRFVARAATGSIGDGAIIGFGLEQGGDLLFQKIAVPFAGFRGKKLKGDYRPASRVFHRVNVPNQLHLDGGLSAAARAKPSFEMQM